ncbi:unnamed protein product [Closterium sp. NIES-64]|nr:unnamed protein product [Closterium sp. NIES-64]
MPPIPVIHTLPPLRYLLSRAAHISSRAHPLPVTPVAFPIPVTSSPSTSILVASPPSHIPSPSHRLPFCRLLPVALHIHRHSPPSPTPPLSPLLPFSRALFIPSSLTTSLARFSFIRPCVSLLSPISAALLPLHFHLWTPTSLSTSNTLCLPSLHPPSAQWYTRLSQPLWGWGVQRGKAKTCLNPSASVPQPVGFSLLLPHPKGRARLSQSAVTTAFPFPLSLSPSPLPPLPLPPLRFPLSPSPSPLPPLPFPLSASPSPLSPSPPPVRLPSVPQPLGLVAVLPPPEGCTCLCGSAVPVSNPQSLLKSTPLCTSSAPPLHPPAPTQLHPHQYDSPLCLNLSGLLLFFLALRVPPAAVRLCLNPHPTVLHGPGPLFENSKKQLHGFPCFLTLRGLPCFLTLRGTHVSPGQQHALPSLYGSDFENSQKSLHIGAPTSLPVSNTRCLPSLQPPPPQYYTLLCLNLPATTTAFPLSPKQTTQPPLRFPPSQYYVPLCLNLSGLVLFFLTLRGVHVSVAVPVSNGATFAFNAAAAYAFGEKIQLYYVPLCLNLSGLVLFFLTLRGVHVSVAVPVSNGATFGFNAAAGYAFGGKIQPYYVPLVPQLSGSVLFFLTLRGVHVSVAVPVSNGATFAFNAAAGLSLGTVAAAYAYSSFAPCLHVDAAPALRLQVKRVSLD